MRHVAAMLSRWVGGRAVMPPRADTGVPDAGVADPARRHRLAAHGRAGDDRQGLGRLPALRLQGKPQSATAIYKVMRVLLPGNTAPTSLSTR